MCYHANDLSCVLLQGIHCSATVVVDYRGYRVIAQTIIPGKFLIVQGKIL